MEGVVKDAIITSSFDDTVLLKLVSLTASAIAQDRHISYNFLDEPAFFTDYFKPWVKEGFEELHKIEESTFKPKVN